MRWVQKKFICECGLSSYELVKETELSTCLTKVCKCGKVAQRNDLKFNGSTKAIMDSIHAEGGVRIFEKGKRKTLATKRDVLEYAKRNNCTFGSDDTEQEAEHQKKLRDKEYTTKITECVIDDWQRLQWQKKTKAR